MNNVLAKNTEYKSELWAVQGSSNDNGKGGVWANGYYLGYSGESFIGLQRNGGLQEIGGNCQIAGVFNSIVPEDEE